MFKTNIFTLVASNVPSAARVWRRVDFSLVKDRITALRYIFCYILLKFFKSKNCIIFIVKLFDVLGFIVKDYREHWGTRCAGCGEYVEGDVVTAGEKHAFHPNCFHCQRCRQPLLGQGTKVTLVQGILIKTHDDSLNRSVVVSVVDN